MADVTDYTVQNIAQILSGLVGNLKGNFWVAAPVHNTSTGIAGQIAYDSGFFYVCISSNSWARVAIGGTW